MKKILLSTLIAMLIITITTLKADNSWVGGVGLYSNPTNWSSGSVPMEDRVLINNGGTMMIDSNDFVNFSWLRVGWDGVGSVVQNGGMVNVDGSPDGNIWLGGNPGINATATYTLNCGTLNTYGANDLGGTTGSNQFIQNGGVYFDHNGGAIIGNFTYTLNGGSYIQAGSGLTMYTGNNNSPAIFNQNGGTVQFSGSLILGNSNDQGLSQYNLNGGMLTIANSTPFQFIQAGGGASFNFLSTGSGQLNLLGSWSFSDLTAIPNTDFRVDGFAANTSNLVFTPTTINGTQYTEVQSVPEPSTYALFGLGGIGVLMVLRRKKTA